MPLVSVIVPVFNGESYIGECLKSIVNQSLKDFEVIIIDDGSTDESGVIADSFSERFSNVKVYHKENQGLIAARIDGVKCAQGKYISFVDADDWIDADFLKLLTDNMIQYDADIVISGCIQEKSNKSVLRLNEFEAGVYIKQKIISEIYPKMLHCEDFFRFGILPYMWNKIYKKELLMECYKNINISIYDGEDVAIVYPYLLKTEKLVVLGDAKYHYRMHSSSMTLNKKDSYYENVSYLYLHLNQIFKESEYYAILLPQLEQYMRMMVWQKETERFIEATKHVFPFNKVPKDTNVVLYGAGLVGKNYHHQILQTDYCKVVCWVDKNYDDVKLRKLEISSPDNIKNVTYDFIVIAIDNDAVKCKVKDFLVRMGVENKRIIM